MRRATAVAALLLFAAGCAAPTTAESAAIRRARDDAARDLARGRPREAFVGLLPDTSSALDRATGRVMFSVGCCGTPERRAYCEAYNDAVRGATGPSAMSFLAKATTRAAVDAALAAPGAVEIRLGGPGADAPGGRFRVDVAPGVGRDAVALWSIDASTGTRDELRYLGADRALVAFSADGATLFVRDDGARASSTYDLPSALFLEVFPDPLRER